MSKIKFRRAFSASHRAPNASSPWPMSCSGAPCPFLDPRDAGVLGRVRRNDAPAIMQCLTAVTHIGVKIFERIELCRRIARSA